MIKSAKFGDVFHLYCTYARHRLKSHAELVRLHNRYLKHLDDRSLSRITRRELQILHSDIGSTAGETAANRAIELVSTTINYAIDWDLFVGLNPASRIKKFKLRSRERFLKAHEIQRFFNALDQCKSQTVRDFVYLCLYTGARSGNVKEMRWREIDLHDKTWRIPDSKNGDPYTVPLIPKAIEVLLSRLTVRDHSEFVFPGQHGGHICNPRKSWYSILQRAGIADLRIHDLRRSLASWQAMTGASLPIIGKTLNHRDPKSTSIYARLDLAPVRSAIQIAVNAMFANEVA